MFSTGERETLTPQPFPQDFLNGGNLLIFYEISGPEPKVRPVIVYIHGGKFAWGSGNLSDGTVFAAYADVVFIAINYRLGVL
ncbi:Neuroligin-1, partial [Orchesella cincta]